MHSLRAVLLGDVQALLAGDILMRSADEALDLLLVPIRLLDLTTKVSAEF